MNEIISSSKLVERSIDKVVQLKIEIYNLKVQLS